MVSPSLTIRSQDAHLAGPSGLSPTDIQTAYNLPSATKGNGQGIAVVEICDNPNVASDLATYRATFGLPASNFSKFNQNGQQSGYPPANYLFGLAIDVDVEMVSATCPNCAIYLIEANGLDQTDMQTAEATAVNLGAHIVVNSWGCTGKGCVDQSYFDTKGVTYIGLGENQDIYPADFDSVVAAGGTYLKKGGGGKRGWTETIWQDGGGCFTDNPKPSWQHDSWCAGRSANDVSIVAWNIAAYDSYNFGGWLNVGGTGVPQGELGGIFGLAGNATKQDGGETFWLPAHQRHLYKLQCNGMCVHGSYSYDDGWGSPNGVGAF